MALTGKQRRFLRALAHHLDPVVMVGNEGLTDAVKIKTEQELLAHELIKVRVLESSPEDVAEVGVKLAEVLSCELVQTIGRIAVVYRKRKKDPEIVLPAP